MDTMIMGLLLLAVHLAAKEGAQSIDMDAMVTTIDSPMANVTVKEGATAVLPCSVKFLGDLKVVWLDPRKRLLTFGVRRIINDKRVSVERPSTEDWNLHIRDVQPKDQGLYMCSVNTYPVLTKIVHLTVQGHVCTAKLRSDQKCSDNSKDGGSLGQIQRHMACRGHAGSDCHLELRWKRRVTGFQQQHNTDQ